MIKKSIKDYYIFGTEMRYLQDATIGRKIRGDGAIMENIDRFLKNLGKLELDVTSRAAWRLREFAEKLRLSIEETLTSQVAAELSSVMSDLRLTLDAEIQGVFAFITTPKRIDSEKLLGDVNFLFAPGVYESFPDIAKYDFSEAGKSIAFELPTAAAFHILRATEANLKYYCKAMVRQKRIATEMWGPIIIDLRKRKSTRKFTTLNNHLDNIRLSFRNPTQHPEAIYDIHEVQDLFSVCIDANNRMFKV
tara:strand:- start:3373 stop:4119 length:747 start_codon:yes stop_codon:yes gene_type:complete